LAVNSYLRCNVDKSILELTNQTNKTTVRLSNSGEDTLYINLNLSEIIDPATSDSVSAELSDPSKDGIIVHPRQLVLRPGQSRSAKVVLSRPVENQDRVFRLNIKPLAGDALPTQQSDRSAGVRILLGYQLLVLARPDKFELDVKLQRKEDSVVFENKSNTSVLLRSGKTASIRTNQSVQFTENYVTYEP